jgi:hypothetical protein
MTFKRRSLDLFLFCWKMGKVSFPHAS